MDEVTKPYVVVGVTGPGRERAALRFAAAHARRAGAQLVLVHATHPGHPVPPAVLITPADALDAGSWVVREVSCELEQMTGGLAHFRALAIPGDPSRVLADIGADASMVVLQGRAATGLGRLLAWSTAHRTVALARCPVVSVNPGWRPQEAPGAVVVVDESGEPRQVLEGALAWADATGALVRVVQVEVRDDAHGRALRSTTEELVDESRAASLIVVGRCPRHGATMHGTSCLVRRLLGRACCPVMVVP